MILQFSTGMLSVPCQMQGQIHLISATYCIRCIRDIIFIEFIITVAKQVTRDPLAFTVQYVGIEVHTFG